MYYPIGDTIWFYIFVIAALEAMAIYTWQFRKVPGGRPQAFLQASKGTWLFFKVLASISTDFSMKFLWIKLWQAMAILTPYLWLVFILQISRQEEKVSRVLMYCIRGIVGCEALLILTSSWHGLIWKEIWMDGLIVHYVAGPLDNLLLIFSYLLCFLATCFSVRWVFKTYGLRRRHALWIALSGVLSWFGNMLGFVPAFRNLGHPLGFLLTGLFITWVFYRWRVYSILPLAQEAAARHMIDGLLVIDEQNYLVDINPAAKNMLNGLPVVVGGKFQEVTIAWPGLAEFDGMTGLDSMEVLRECPEGTCYYQLNRIVLQTSNRNFLGRIILLKDITKQKQDQNKMVEQQKALSILAERDRLGRELHDGQGQLWGYINMQVEAVRSLLENKNLAQAQLLLEQMAAITQDRHVDIREAITGLQAAVTTEQGFLRTLEEYLQWFRQNYEVNAELVISNDFAAELLVPITEVQLLRIIQEALTNIRKYARAHHVKVFMRVNGSFAEIRVEDDGCGFDLTIAAKKKGSFGLRIMQERAAEIGAQFTIQSAPNAGTKIIIQVPLT